MKALIFLIVIGVVVSVMIWTMRKSQAEADLVRRKAIKHRKKQEKEVLATKEDMVWPTIIRSVKGDLTSSADSEIEEPAMTAIKFEQDEYPASQQESSTKAGAYQ
jgi:regulatory protein YycH of two-component signal transduction system YycFG